MARAGFHRHASGISRRMSPTNLPSNKRNQTSTANEATKALAALVEEPQAAITAMDGTMQSQTLVQLILRDLGGQTPTLTPSLTPTLTVCVYMTRSAGPQVLSRVAAVCKCWRGLLREASWLECSHLRTPFPKDFLADPKRV